MSEAVMLPQSSAVQLVAAQLKAFSNVDVQVKYRDTSGTNAGTKQVTVSKLNFDLTKVLTSKSYRVQFGLKRDLILY
jgi:hypothetical protein